MNTPAQPQPSLPMLFQQVAVLDSERHAGLRLDRGRDYGFAAKTNVVPVAINEFPAAAGDYPVVFGPSGQPAALAIVGFRDRENLFIDAGGAWQPGIYVPAYLRNYPFALIESSDREQVTMAIDPTAKALSPDAGAPLFAERQPTPPLKEAMDLCLALHRSLIATREFCAALEGAGLLVDNRAQIQFKQGGTATLGGFRIVDAAKFDALDDARILEWRKKGWLAPIYAHLLSQARWSRIVDLGARAIGAARN